MTLYLKESLFSIQTIPKECKIENFKNHSIVSEEKFVLTKDSSVSDGPAANYKRHCKFTSAYEYPCHILWYFLVQISITFFEFYPTLNSKICLEWVSELAVPQSFLHSIERSLSEQWTQYLISGFCRGWISTRNSPFSLHWLGGRSIQIKVKLVFVKDIFERGTHVGEVSSTNVSSLFPNTFRNYRSIRSQGSYNKIKYTND